MVAVILQWIVKVSRLLWNVSSTSFVRYANSAGSTGRQLPTITEEAQVERGGR